MKFLALLLLPFAAASDLVDVFSAGDSATLPDGTTREYFC
ncbi:hypothetical protein TeGR_g1623, partial [Tetraparma gracilis]